MRNRFWLPARLVSCLKNPDNRSIAWQVAEKGQARWLIVGKKLKRVGIHHRVMPEKLFKIVQGQCGVQLVAGHLLE